MTRMLRKRSQAAKPVATRKDEQQVLAVNQAWADAEADHDNATLQRILGDRFVVTDAAGQTIDKEAFIEKLLRLSLASQTVAHDIVRIHGDTAVVIGTTTVSFLVHGKEETQAFRYTATYIKRDGRWRAIAEQLGQLVPRQ